MGIVAIKKCGPDAVFVRFNQGTTTQDRSDFNEALLDAGGTLKRRNLTFFEMKSVHAEWEPWIGVRFSGSKTVQGLVSD